ncbi:MAG: hypothetical protein HC809_08175, partial [Gammaproteobacteria bacterium]|nr:hypothetical protein [Gammaproteobacteria bacterium]
VDPALAAEIERNLAILRAAQVELEASLAARPDDPQLLELLRYAMQREIELLADATAMRARSI